MMKFLWHVFCGFVIGQAVGLLLVAATFAVGYAFITGLF
jgi:hypothetical protein